MLSMNKASQRKIPLQSRAWRLPRPDRKAEEP